ncbi:hypothetical protein EL22_22225 [Halostagnicola sp. A56]|uniref:hypothetical protein n=1 Tax=Halostagnicola sp. A56 TaxID=1495067 RepID=UPI0004A07BF5|nr:hypothetical protein [Halostagnicola sp. A56]KDE60450.1 hypothetical protein EL22_22225 [Halostagnicola sp. A56]
MRFKPVPEPPADLAAVATVRAAVPEHPDEGIDCCTWLIDRTHLEERDEAADWLTFLRALELARDDPDGFTQTTRAIDLESLRTAFRERVVGVEAILETLEAADRPLEPADVCNRVRTRASGEEALERTERLLEWAALLEFVAVDADRYRLR